MAIPGVAAYLDDILCHTDTPSKHLDLLVKTFEAHRAAGIKLKAKKTKLFQSSVEYLGHTISCSGISVPQSSVQLIQDWTAPRNAKELSGFLGFLGYFSTFLMEFASLTANLNSLRNRKKGWEWREEHQRDFDQLKQAFLQAPNKGFPDLSLPTPLTLHTDFSGKAVAAVLTQIQGGREVFLGARGRKLRGYENCRRQ